MAGGGAHEKPARLLAAEKPELLESYRAEWKTGPIGGRGRHAGAQAEKPLNNWSEGKIALDYLVFAAPRVAAHRVRFQRDYASRAGVPEAVLDAPTPAEDEAQRRLLLIAAVRLGPRRSLTR